MKVDDDEGGHDGFLLSFESVLLQSSVFLI